MIVRSLQVLPFPLWCKCSMQLLNPLRKKVTVHQVPTMLATSKNVVFPGYNHLVAWYVKFAKHFYTWPVPELNPRHFDLEFDVIDGLSILSHAPT